MPEYPTVWQDYHLPQAQEFSIAVCSYSGRVRHLTIGPDPLRQALIKGVKIEAGECNAGHHCLALECKLNHTKKEHLMHMLDMYADEPADEESVKLFGKNSVVDCLVELARQISESLLSNNTRPTSS